ncbi:hypothetical protein NEOLEDRAFT_224492 [Neolentinus lepideus HHB14362 ss-1]|uniref:Uncharacterized protein n=1 Tax=Neolentinus lepideus HHB14362 ss-1 TaxID=1314782 RepID=A0A165TCY6_9AGAM|nr:hypothetical protein NEOLEDRAFT_224492 [Neolentinus lepideus HHB14362 ss-1]
MSRISCRVLIIPVSSAWYTRNSISSRLCSEYVQTREDDKCIAQGSSYLCPDGRKPRCCARATRYPPTGAFELGPNNRKEYCSISLSDYTYCPNNSLFFAVGLRRRKMSPDMRPVTGLTKNYQLQELPVDSFHPNSFGLIYPSQLAGPVHVLHASRRLLGERSAAMFRGICAQVGFKHISAAHSYAYLAFS